MRNNPIPVRASLVEECVRVILLRLESGEWSHGFPGERTLARKLEVGRDTLRLALQRLEQENVLSPAAPGRKRMVLEPRSMEPAGRNQGLRLGILSPRRLEQLPQTTLFEVDHLRRALAQNGGSLDLFAPAWFEHADPTKHLAKLVEEEPCSAWVLFRSGEKIQQWFSHSGIPCLVRGYPYSDGLLPHLDVDWEATARHAAGRLWRAGHRRAGILIPHGHLRGVAAAVRGAADLREPDFELIEMQENGTNAGACKVMARMLKTENPPTAIIATRPRQVATALTWLGMHRIRVPADFGIISLAYEPFMDDVMPEISGYRVEPETASRMLIRRVKALISGLHGRARSSWISPKVIKGDSIGRGA